MKGIPNAIMQQLLQQEADPLDILHLRDNKHKIIPIQNLNALNDD